MIKLIVKMEDGAPSEVFVNEDSNAISVIFIDELDNEIDIVSPLYKPERFNG